MSYDWSLNLRILDPSGNPVEMAAVAITSSPVPLPDIAALTGPDGQVSMSVPCEGVYGVMVNAEGYAVVVDRIGAVEGEAIRDVSLNQ
jgi:uncharacterized protein (DUF697 family)